MAESTQCYCKVCERTMDSTQFYQSRRIDKYPPNGHFNECKKCLTRHVNNFDPRTYMWILQEADVPYIEDEWNGLLMKYGKDKTKMTGMTILGRYLSKMKLKQYSEYRWDDTEKLKSAADARTAEVMARQGYSGEEIEKKMNESGSPTEMALNPAAAPVSEDEPEPIDNVTPEYFNDDLTDEDKKYLSIKWGRVYKPYEWVQLEQYYTDMCSAFDIQTPAHMDYLKLICKTSLKCHQLLDLGDVDGFQKMSKTYDMLMKSAKFTAAQNKDINGEYVSAVDELIKLAEQEGFIPRYYVEGPNDKVDETVKDMRGYLDNLVRDELNLGNLIEGAIKQLKVEEAKQEDEDIDDELEDEDLEEILKDKDFEEHYDFLEDEKDVDQRLMESLEQDGE